MGRPVAMGLTVAIPADDMPPDPAAAKSYVRDLAEQATVALRRYVGDAPPRGDLQVRVDGPQDDPIQGLIYALSVAAPFDPDDLPADCDAYLTYRRGEGATVYTEPGDALRNGTPE